MMLTVYTTWQATRTSPAVETRKVFHDWTTARRHALQTACLAGARYVTLCVGSDEVVHGEWDRYTNRWREYMRPGGTEF
ncbi:hypothetical protein [Micromonospora sp. NPDC049891]|uniref:hypothetical protein n=1 Tax=Micromonospora sp. NPDC049891 TaxID=3155655 RepID=UPI0033EBF05B